MQTFFSSMRSLSLLVVGLVAAFVTEAADAQPPFQIQPDTHRVRIVNEMGQQIRVKVIGFSHQSRYSVDLWNNRSVSQEFYSGPRMLGIFDARGELLVTAPLLIDRSGTLRLRGIFAAQEAPSDTGEPGAEPVQRAMRSGFQIEEE